MNAGTARNPTLQGFGCAHVGNKCASLKSAHIKNFVISSVNRIAYNQLFAFGYEV